MALSNFYLTDAGNALLARAQVGEQLTITRAQVGEGTWPTETTYANITALVTPVKYMTLTGMTVNGDQTKIGIQFTNSGVGRAFQWTEFALWAADPDHPDDRSYDILYGTAYAGDTPVPIESALTEFLFNVIIKVGRATNVTVLVDSSLVYLTNNDLQEMMGQPGGIPTIGQDGKIPEAQIPDIYVKKTGDTMTGSLEVDGGTAWKSVGARRKLSNGKSHVAALGVGSAGGGAIEVTEYDENNQNPKRVNRLDLTTTGLQLGLVNKYAPENYLSTLPSGSTILDFANSCKVTSSILCVVNAIPSDAPVPIEGHIIVLVGGGGRKDVLFIPFENAIGAVYMRAIYNNVWRWTSWNALSGLVGSVTLYVSPSGSDTTGNGGSTTPYATLAKALSTLPKDLNGKRVNISMAGGTYTEARVAIDSFHNGVLFIYGTDSAHAVLNNGASVTNCSAKITMQYLDFKGTASAAGLNVQYSDSVAVMNGNFTGQNASGSYVGIGALVSGMSNVLLRTCDFKYFNNAIEAHESSVYIQLLTGSTNNLCINSVDGSIVSGGLNGLTGAALYRTSYGGRIYTGAQTNAPVY